MFDSESKRLVVQHIEHLMKQAKIEHPQTEFAPMPMFYPEHVEEFLWNSLVGVFAIEPYESGNAIGTILATMKVIEKQPEKDQFKAYKELMEYACKADDGFTERYFQKHPEQKREVSCKKGCAFCCMQEIQLNAVEAKHYWKIVPRGGRFEKQKEQSTFNVRDPEQERGKSAQGNYVRRLGLEDSKCPFLDGKNECSIYDDRPLVCRYYEVYDDPSVCHPMTLKDAPTMRLPIFTAVVESAMFETFGFTTLQADGTIVKVQRNP